MKKINKLLAVLFCAIALVIGFSMKPGKLSAFAYKSETMSFGPVAQEIQWSGFNYKDLPSIDYSRTDMFNTSQTKYTGSNYYSFSLKQNYTGKSRTGKIYAKKNGKTVATLTVVQEPIILTISPQFYGSEISGNGQEITYTIASNMQFKVYRWGEGISTDLICTKGTNQKKAGCINPYTVKVKYAPNVSASDLKYVGIRAEASNNVQTKTYYQPVHTHVWGDYITTEKATCTTCGSKYHVCKVDGCGERETKVITPHGHSMITVSQTPRSCTKEGILNMKCKYDGCSYTYSTTLPKLSHSYAMKYSDTNGVYVQCTNSGCSHIAQKKCTYNDCLNYIKGGDTKANRLAYAKLYYSAKNTTNVDWQTIASSYDLYNCDPGLIDLLEDINYVAEHTSDFSIAGDILDNETLSKIGAYSDYYQIGYSMFKLVNSTNPEQASKNMMDTCQKAISLCPITDLVYGKTVGFVYEKAVKVAKEAQKRTKMADLLLINTDYPDYKTMTVRELAEQYDTLFSGESNPKAIAKMYIHARIAYEAYKYKNNIKTDGTVNDNFIEFIQNDYKF